MAERPIWRGHLRLALVSCPVALYSARHDRGRSALPLHQPEDRQPRADGHARCGDRRGVSRGELVKGYEFKKDHYLLLER